MGAVDALCDDCGFDTIGHRRGRYRIGCQEYYMVKDELWPFENEWPVHHYLCIACLEVRLGRILTPDDFTDADINEPHPWDTARLEARKVGL
jgi:hypothetical protein